MSDSLKRSWSQEELNFLKEFWAKGVPIKEIAYHLGRTTTATNKALTRAHIRLLESEKRQSQTKRSISAFKSELKEALNFLKPVPKAASKRGPLSFSEQEKPHLKRLKKRLKRTSLAGVAHLNFYDISAVLIWLYETEGINSRLLSLYQGSFLGGLQGEQHYSLMRSLENARKFKKPVFSKVMTRSQVVLFTNKLRYDYGLPIFHVKEVTQ